MDSIFSFYSKLRAQGVSEVDALQQAIHAARSNVNVPFKTADDPDTGASSRSKLDLAKGLYASGLRGKQFADEFRRVSTLPENTALQFVSHVKDQQGLYTAIASAGFQDGSYEFTELFMTAASDLPLQKR